MCSGVMGRQPQIGTGIPPSFFPGYTMTGKEKDHSRSVRLDLPVAACSVDCNATLSSDNISQRRIELQNV